MVPPPELDDEFCESSSDDEFEPPQDKISEDPFGIYNILNKQDNKEAGQDSDPSHPPGFTQEVNVGVSVNLPVHSDIRGILCVWDPNSFVKDNATISDYFVAVRARLSDLDKLFDNGLSNEELVTERISLLKELHNFNKSHSLDLAQKAKVRWAIEGDENSKYFHGIINKKRSQLAIRGVLIDGDWIDEPCKVKNEFLMHFANRFESPSGPCIDIDSYREFFISVVIPSGCNSSFIALIPKKHDAKFVKDYRPISLIGCFYKIVSKILANRLKMVISELISDVQSAFMDFLDIILRNFGFGIKWRGWIQGCLSSAMGSILVNGSPTAEFKFHKGIRFDDSLTLSHLFYADDAVFIGKWDRANILTIVPNIMGVLLFSTPFAYSWCQDSSVGGRLTLIKSVLTSLPLYHMSLYKAPLGVLRDLESLRRKFFNGADINEKRFSMISWNKILASKQKGGLGVSSFFALNRSLLFKWVWRFLSQDASLWNRLIAVLYGNRSPFVHTGSVSSLSPWNCILKELNSLSAKGINLLALLKKKVGNGANTLFWEMLLICPLSRSFPRLYALELKKGITVADKLIDASFVASFRRNPRGGVEEEQLHHLVELVGVE
ncbi:hypothetical protein Tco_0927897 [Tanacetum coccineum]